MTDHWDPEPHEREWFRHKMDGGMVGWLVRRGGQDYVQLNRPGSTPTPYRPHDWIAERAPAVLNHAQASLIAFEAHKAFCKVVGDYSTARREWINMSDEARRVWMKNGPKNYAGEHAEVMNILHNVIMQTLEPLTR